MKIKDFKLERYFAKYEFNVKYLLSSSDCDGFPLKYVLEQANEQELALWEGIQLGYTESEGNPLLRSSIANLYQNISPQQVLVASPGEANFSLMNVLLEPGDHVICMRPAYQSLYQVVKSIGANLSFWEPNPESWFFDPDQLRQLIKAETKLIIINFPHNPTGAFPKPEELQAVVEIAREAGVYLFSDEMYRLLTHDSMEEIPAVCDVYEKGISLWGMAKSFGLAGLRMGWLASQDQEVLQHVLAYKDYLSICNSAPSEHLALIALNHQEAFLKPNLEKIQANVKLFQEFQIKHADFLSFVPPKAGSTAFAKLHKVKSSLAFSEKMVKEVGIMTVPAEMFEYGSQHIRIGFGRENFPKALEVFHNYLSEK